MTVSSSEGLGEIFLQGRMLEQVLKSKSLAGGKKAGKV